MSAPPEDDLAPTSTPGYKPTPTKSLDEYAKLDANDESLNRWKASLGIHARAADSSVAQGPKMTLLTLELHSTTLPPGKEICVDLQDLDALANSDPIRIKEGVEYNVRITFKVNHSVVTGIRYIQVVKRAGIRVDKLEEMIGSYGPNPTPIVKNFEPGHSPSGTLARSGTYNAISRVIDDDGTEHARWAWSFKLTKEW